MCTSNIIYTKELILKKVKAEMNNFVSIGHKMRYKNHANKKLAK